MSKVIIRRGAKTTSKTKKRPTTEFRRTLNAPAVKRPKPTILYMAYGSNLHIRSMMRRCPDAEPIGTRMLNNARLVFRGVADLAFEPDHLAPVALWNISTRDEASLDGYEGVSAGIYGRYWIPLGGGYRGRRALVYLMHDTGIFPPSAHYVSTIRDGYRNFRLDQSFLDEAIAHSYDQKTPTTHTRDRRGRQRALRQPLVEMPEEVALARLDSVQLFQQTQKFPFQLTYDAAVEIIEE